MPRVEAVGTAEQSSVQLNHISKKYRVYSRPSDRLREILSLRGNSCHSEVVALNDISLDIKKGTTFGILGRNGSGKSTLLQIIAGVLKPTQGEVLVHGRVSALLELGSGFNPDFTGIENVYLYSSILGLGKVEIDAKLDSILKFAEIGDFVYQPVSTYSSGMMVRLAFATAVSIDPDILIVDEALAVGDALFQHKCILRMREIMRSGATVIFVSHDINSVKSLCREAVLLENGNMVYYGKAEDVANEYHRRMFEEQANSNQAGSGSEIGFSINQENKTIAEVDAAGSNKAILTWPASAVVQKFQERACSNRFGIGQVSIEYLETIDGKGQVTSFVNYGDRITVRIYVRAQIEVSGLVVGFVLRDSKGVDILASNTRIEQRPIKDVMVGERLIVDFVLENVLGDDRYSVNPAVIHEDYFHQARYFDWVNNASILNVAKPESTIVYGLFYPTDMVVNTWRGPDIESGC